MTIIEIKTTSINWEQSLQKRKKKKNKRTTIKRKEDENNIS